MSTERNLLRNIRRNIDLVVGGGVVEGLESGRILNIVGDKSTGKSFLAGEIIANAYNRYKDRFKWFYDNCELGFTFDTKSLYGIDIIPDYDSRSQTVEELYCNYRMFLESISGDDVGISVVDSLEEIRDIMHLKKGKILIKVLIRWVLQNFFLKNFLEV